MAGAHSTPPFPALQAECEPLIWWVLRQVQADLNEACCRRWLAASSALARLTLYRAELAGRLALAEMAEASLTEALAEAGELIEGAAAAATASQRPLNARSPEGAAA